MWRWSAFVIFAACVASRDGSEAEEKAALPARAVEHAAPPAPPTPPVTEPAPRPLGLDDVLPAGTGWKCVHEKCDRTCIYPRRSHAPGPNGRVVALSNNPPCVDQDKAFCAAFTITGQAPRALCRATREACEAERQRDPSGATACEER